MPFGSWIVENLVRINVQGLQNLERMTGAASAADVRFARLTGQISSQEAAWLRYRRSVDQARESQRAMLTTAAAGGFVVLGASLAYAVKGAADLQKQITGVQIATNQLNDASAAEYTKLAIHVSDQTAQNAGTIAQEMATAATSGLNDPKKLTDAFPRMAKAADALWMSPKGLDPVESIRAMSQLAHLFGVYDGAPLQHMLDRSTEMALVQPEGIQQLVTQGRLFLPPAMSAGVPEEDIWKQAMTMGQTGFLRSRGGSGLANVIEALAGATSITGHLSKMQRAAMERVGLMDSGGLLRSAYRGSKGELLLQKVVDHLEAVRANTDPLVFLSDITNAFGKQGGRYMGDILRPGIYQKAQQNWETMNKMGGVDKIWAQYSDKFFYQWAIFTTNLENVFKVVGGPMLPGLGAFFGALGADLGRMNDYLENHQDAAKTIGDLTFAITGFLGAVTVVGGTTQALKFLGILDELPNAFLVTLAPLRWFYSGLLAIGAPAKSAAQEAEMVAGAFRAVAGAGAAFLNSPLGVFLSRAGGLVAGATISMQQQSNATAAYEAMAKRHGYKYANYLLHGGPGGGGVGDWPWNFDPVGTKGGLTMPQGALTPRDWKLLHSGTGKPISYVNNSKVEIHIHDATDPKKVGVVVKGVISDLFSNPRSLLGQSGTTRTAANIPMPLAAPPA